MKLPGIGNADANKIIARGDLRKDKKTGHRQASLQGCCEKRSDLHQKVVVTRPIDTLMYRFLSTSKWFFENEITNQIRAQALR